MDFVRSEPLGPEQGVGQVNEQPKRDDAGERIIEDHGGSPSKQIAGVDVADRKREQDETDRQHDEVCHGNVLAMTHFKWSNKQLRAVTSLDLRQKFEDSRASMRGSLTGD
jgi:hypothetical protein